ncbi:exopolysaccharide biosynthesis polyprenyl glycosylphosphotransferase [Methylocapsa aurea]|uniref:exopolysaccharide biosynthesis polyprenyl glycosylphosphotransferase n=1 Tax=Methylocapsa aurea TaxID=663610 RepID=UPI002477DC0F|nr:exopolysaccharide biosynthesis polyprenyl glycosylphosphotransferase [Methylocapsa aurea]
MTQFDRPPARSAWPSFFSWRYFASSKHEAWIRSGFAFLAASSDLCAISLGALGADMIMRLSAHEALDGVVRLNQFGVLVAVIFLAANMFQGDYAHERYLAFKVHFRRSCLAWFMTFPAAVTIAFMMEATAGLPRVSVGLFFCLGLGLLSINRLLFAQWIKASAGRGGMAAKRIFLLGREEEIERFYQLYEPAALGMRIVTASVLRGPDHLDEDLALAAASARIFRPEDVFILVPWAQRETVDCCVTAFLRIPAAIHLGSDCVLNRFAKAQVATTGPISSLNLARPLSSAHVLAKRVFDITLALIALALLAPLLAALAIAIKLDSKGPAIFRQRRYGFNQEPFRIFKFRSMTTLEDGRKLRQATSNDARVTRVGRFMRRTNLDELPQLFNVLLGDMSLVGPRPHALAHDQLFEPSVALYARRHNVKPGITGWAQANGLRGEITEASLKARIEHDLFYIDHSSLWLDLQIIWRTIMSKKAFKNAY